MQAHVPVLTFNAPQMGWVFDKRKVIPDPMAPQGYRYELVREGRLGKVDVMSIRTNRDPVSGLRLYDEDGKQVGNRYRIGGRLLTLGDTVGRLESYFEEESNRQSQIWHPRTEWEKPTPKWLQESQSGLFFWHTTNTLELALMDRVEDEEEEPEEVDPPQVPKDPIILDLDRDGKVSTTPGKRYFNMDANGVAERVSWAASGDGFLVMDRDGDGKITSGRERRAEEADGAVCEGAGPCRAQIKRIRIAALGSIQQPLSPSIVVEVCRALTPAPRFLRIATPPRTVRWPLRF